MTDHPPLKRQISPGDCRRCLRLIGRGEHVVRLADGSHEHAFCHKADQIALTIEGGAGAQLTLKEFDVLIRQYRFFELEYRRHERKAKGDKAP